MKTAKLGEGSTPGPQWTVNRIKSPIYGSDGSLVAEGFGIGAQSKFVATVLREPDARLIAKAPLLIEAREVLDKLRTEMRLLGLAIWADNLSALLAKLDAE